MLKTFTSQVSGIESSNEKNSAGEIASMALEVVEKMKNCGIEHRGKPLVVRIGVHTGKLFFKKCVLFLNIWGKRHVTFLTLEQVSYGETTVSKDA